MAEHASPTWCTPVPPTIFVYPGYKLLRCSSSSLERFCIVLRTNTGIDVQRDLVMKYVTVVMTVDAFRFCSVQLVQALLLRDHIGTNLNIVRIQNE